MLQVLSKEPLYPLKLIGYLVLVLVIWFIWPLSYQIPLFPIPFPGIHFRWDQPEIPVYIKIPTLRVFFLLLIVLQMFDYVIIPQRKPIASPGHSYYENFSFSIQPQMLQVAK